PHGFVLAVRPREHNMVRWGERFEFDAPAAFGTGGSVGKRHPQCPMRSELCGPLDGLRIGSRLDAPAATIDGVCQSGKSERRALRFLEDQDKGIGIALPDAVCG